MSRVIRLVLAACCLLGPAAPVLAQAEGDSSAARESAFTLSSSEVFTTRDSPSFSLTFRHLTQLDFRVYRVRDPFTFFSGGTPGIGRGKPDARNDAPFASSRSSQQLSRGTDQSSDTAHAPGIDPGSHLIPDCSPAAIRMAPLSRIRLTISARARS